MAWFGKSEEELQDWQQKLDGRERSLNEEQAQLNRQQSDLANRDTIVKVKSEELTKKDADIRSRKKRSLNASWRQRILLLKSSAKHLRKQSKFN